MIELPETAEVISSRVQLFTRQAERLAAKTAILTRGTFNEGAWKQRNPAMAGVDIKRLKFAVAYCARMREEDVKEANGIEGK